MRMTRRSLLAITAAGTLTVACDSGSADAPLSIFGGGIEENEGSAGTVLPSAVGLPTPYTLPLRVPPVLRPVASDATGDHFVLTQRRGLVEILPGRRTEIWGYDGLFPGPTLVSRRGRRSLVTHRNRLAVPTVVHLHGGRTPPEHDGHPLDLLLPVGRTDDGMGGGPGGVVTGERTYEYPMEQPAGTLWYHDHRMDFTGPQVYRGLAGFHLVTDEVEAALGLPQGARDVPLMITDRSFGADGQLAYPAADASGATPGVDQAYASGVLGDCILVNGTPWPVMEVDTAVYRLRLLNASNARRYELVLDPAPASGPPFLQIGADACLLPSPVSLSEIRIAQAQRYDVLVDFRGNRPGDELTLRNRLGQGGTEEVMRFRVGRAVDDPTVVPHRLAAYTALSPDDVTVERQFWFSRGGSQDGMALWTVNGEPFDPGRVDADPRWGAVERWTVHALNVPHPFHLHAAPFQVSEQEDDVGPVVPEPGWRDVVNLDNGGSATFLVRFDGYRGRYVFHCHNLEHEDMRMMATIEVV